MRKSLQLIAAIAVCSLAVAALAQKPTPPTGKQKPSASSEQKPEKKPGELKKYDEVITKEAKTQDGLFKVHQVGEKLYWEIPTNMLGRDMLWQTEVARMPDGYGYPGLGAGTHLIRFSRRENKIYMHEVSTGVRAVGDDATRLGVEETNVAPILDAWDVQTEGKNKAAVIEVARLFTSDAPPFQVAPFLGAGGVEPSKSYLEKVKAFPQNIETRSQLTFGSAPQRPGFFSFGGPQGPATVTVHYSLDLLPEKPMMGRLKDSRIGYFTQGFTEYGRSDNRAVEKEYIDRFRLEKKDPTAEVSEPVKPITFYLAREVPNKWRPALKRSIEAWQPAFEASGFKNAILCKDAPSVKEDPDWDPEDARYSVIRWAPSEVENAMGPSIQDPRSGETLSAHVIVWNNIVKLLEDWHFSQAGAIDPTAHVFPYDDAKMGSMIEYVVTHEVGHTLGLEHNFKASVAYTIQQLRDPEFMKTHGTASSIMSYSRNDYVAQPGDGVESYHNRIGPYDYFAIEYGYKPIAGAYSPESEKPELDKLLSRQVDDPSVRFGNYKFMGLDPEMQMENISNDPVEAARLGLKNIDYIAETHLMPATIRTGDPYDMLSEMYDNLIGQRFTELFHVLNLVGGVVETDYHGGRGGDVFKPVPRKQQAAAVKLLTTEGFSISRPLTNPDVINKVTPGQVTMVTGIQTMLIRSLISDARVSRMTDNEAVNGKDAYTVAQLVGDVSKGVWTELDSPIPQVDTYRRSLQRAYLKVMDTKVNGGNASSSDLKALERDDLQHLAKRIDQAMAHVQGRITYAHLANCRSEIEKILTGTYSKSPSGGGASSFFFGAHQFDPKSCWTPWPTLSQAAWELEQEEKKDR